MWFSVASPRPGPNPPPYQRSSLRWSPAVCSPRASCSLEETVGCSEQNSSSHGYAKCRRPAAIHTLERPDMSPRISESPFTWLSLTGISVPPRNPNNNNGEDEEDEEDDKREPAVIREPDKDE